MGNRHTKLMQKIMLNIYKIDKSERKEIDEKYADGDYSQIDNDDIQALREKSDSLGRNAEWLLDQDNIYADASAIKR